MRKRPIGGVRSPAPDAPCRHVAVASALAFMLLAWCAAPPPPAAAQSGGARPATLPSSSARGTLAKARTWGYLLQNVTASPLQKSDYDVLVLDAGTPQPGAQLSRADISRLKRKGDGSRRILLAYINIGEAEDYRYYWSKAWEKSPPGWLGSANCRWKGDHRVRHWAPEWQSIVYGTPKSYIGRIMDAGFDGVWLDRVDIFYHWRGERWQAAVDMIDFVERLSKWAKARNPDFLVVPQNGEELLSDARYIAAIDGQGKEDMLFGDRGNDVPNTEERVRRAERNIKPARDAGLPVLAVEYARQASNRVGLPDRLRGLGLIPYLGPRSLAYLGTEGPTHKEDGDSEPTIADAGDDGCG